MRGLVFALAVALATGAALAQSIDDANRAAQEREAKQKLDAVRAEIRTLTEAQRATAGEREDATKALREREVAVAAAVKELRAVDAKLATQQAELDALQKRQAELETTLKSQRDALAALLRSAYALGRHEELKLLLQQEDVATIARVLAYHRYFQRARVGRIDELLGDLAKLAEVQQAIEKQNAELLASRAQREQESTRLAAERDARGKALAELDAKLKDQQARLGALGKDEKALAQLLERLRDIFADIPKQLAGAEPFAASRGRMSWPVPGKILTPFGANDDSGRRSAGVLIAAKAGSEVRAVSHGRVAFADWFKGYGFLIIVDHGDGYLSLYGYNEALLKDVGDWVAANEPIATSGASGGQRAAGVYFELRYRGQPQDPRSWLK